MLLREIRSAERSRQKVLRARLRRQFDFYITDFATDQQGFSASDVDTLVRRGVIIVIGEDPNTPEEGAERLPRASIPDATSASARPPARPTVPWGLTRAEIESAGFIGWQTWEDLRANDLLDVAADPGVYIVYRPSMSPPDFREVSPAGRFKGRDPTVPPATLAAKWVPEANVVYIGKADTLRTRLRQYARFGAGAAVGHWGGRYIWQLMDSDELLVAWHPITWDEVAREYERRMLAWFQERHGGRRPFANLTG